jgi:hypothetical protein
MSALGVDAPVRSRRSWAFLSNIRAISATKRADVVRIRQRGGERVSGGGPRTRIASPRRAAWDDSATRRSRPAT